MASGIAADVKTAKGDEVNTISDFSGLLVVTRCWCGIQHAVPESLYENQREQRDNGLKQTAIFCPLGHEWVSKGTSRVEALEQQVAAERARHDQTKAELREERNRVNSERAAKSRLKNRIKNGICPCCKRSFANLHRHMQGQHPEFGQENKSHD